VYSSGVGFSVFAHREDHRRVADARHVRGVVACAADQFAAVVVEVIDSGLNGVDAALWEGDAFGVHPLFALVRDAFSFGRSFDP